MARILIVEDETDIAQLYCIVLEDRGHYVLGPYSDPREPIERAKELGELPIDMIILDERLGRLSGTAYLSVYRQSFPGAKIVLVSADPDAVAAGRSNGADSVLKKPVPLALLLEHVSQLLSETPAGG
jgi:two-component system, NarL family, nitrate/nitrite response regulator NarL